MAGWLGSCVFFEDGATGDTNDGASKGITATCVCITSGLVMGLDGILPIVVEATAEDATGACGGRAGSIPFTVFCLDAERSGLEELFRILYSDEGGISYRCTEFRATGIGGINIDSAADDAG